MTPNNNLSILPWYTSLGQQNARRWWIYGRVYPLFVPAGFLPPFQIMRPHYGVTEITSFLVYTKDGELVGDYTSDMENAISFKSFTALGYDVLVFTGLLPFFQSFPEGQYYCVLEDGLDKWYSEVFTVVGNVDNYLKLTWWDTEDFTMRAGTIVYSDPAYKNILYLDATIAKPDYVFDEEGENRDGYFFPTKQVSEKRYRFKFFASEYLLDVMRFIRMSDYAFIEFQGQQYGLDSFLITPEWESNGDVASVEAEFDTATAAKKLGKGYIMSQRGDFNDDYNDDYNNQQ